VTFRSVGTTAAECMRAVRQKRKKRQRQHGPRRAGKLPNLHLRSRVEFCASRGSDGCRLEWQKSVHPASRPTPQTRNWFRRRSNTDSRLYKTDQRTLLRKEIRQTDRRLSARACGESRAASPRSRGGELIPGRCAGWTARDACYEHVTPSVWKPLLTRDMSSLNEWVAVAGPGLH
jgi:hypothetical protein